MRFTLFILIMTFTLMFTPFFANAQLPSTVDETSLAVTYNNIAGEAGWGALGTLPYGKRANRRVRCSGNPKICYIDTYKVSRRNR